MYLIRMSEAKTRQVYVPSSDATEQAFYRWVRDNNMSVFRFHQGRFESLTVVDRIPEGGSGKCVLPYPEWNEVPVEQI